MTIDTLHFTPWSALAGGLLIGLAAAALILFNGRIAGISGIAGGLLRPARGDTGWRIAFLLGLVAAPLVYLLGAPLPEVQGRGRLRRPWSWPDCWSASAPATAPAAPAATASAACRACRRARWRPPPPSCSPASPPSSSCAT